MMCTGTIEMQVCFADSLDFLLMVISIFNMNCWTCSVMLYGVNMHVLFLWTGAIAASGSYTEGSLTFGITDIHCNGTEQNISICAHNQGLLHNCQSHNDAGVVCQSTDINFMIMLVFKL